jgi:hypothetical protein
MNLKLKAFIYRLSDVFGRTIYLADEEEQLYIELLTEAEGPLSEMWEGIERGSWQGHYGFTTVWTYKQPWYKATWEKLKHTFDFRTFP